MNPKQQIIIKSSCSWSDGFKFKINLCKILDNTGQSDDALKEYSYVLDKSTSDNKDILYTLERTFKKNCKILPITGI